LNPKNNHNTTLVHRPNLLSTVNEYKRILITLSTKQQMNIIQQRMYKKKL